MLVLHIVLTVFKVCNYQSKDSKPFTLSKANNKIKCRLGVMNIQCN